MKKSKINVQTVPTRFNSRAYKKNFTQRIEGYEKKIYHDSIVVSTRQHAVRQLYKFPRFLG